MIKAPFNFVPVNQTVFFPYWAVRISHDVPFSDGISGYIDITITAETSLFIRNGQGKDGQDNRFSQTPDGKYFIPGTSIKGELRNVLEAISFGKMGRVQNRRFGYRDLSNSAAGKQYKDKLHEQAPHCGWLYRNREDNRYYIRDCGEPYRISPATIDNELGMDLDAFAWNVDSKTEENKTAKIKYDKIKDTSGSIFYKGYFCLGNTDNSLKPREVIFCTREDKDSFPGIIVVTGQSSKRKKNDKSGKYEGKYYEFVFNNASGQTELEVDENIFEEFKNIHENSADYDKLWKDRLNKGEEIPVFFTSRGKNVEAIGLAYMFRYPTANTIHSAMPIDHLLDNVPDLAECIFGYTGKISGSLKGRVAVSHAFASSEVRVEEEEVTVVLASPKPSYYPLYVRGGQSWNAGSILISGRKRYPVRNQTNDSPDGNAEMESKMIPVKPGTSFSGRIRFFNLRPVELGALLASINFLGHKECFHSLGEGKPLGYGKVKMEINKFSADTKESVSDLIDCFKVMMRSEILNWESSPQIMQLLAMAQGIPDNRKSDFTYMRMDKDNKGNNEFLNAKNDREYLPYFSDILKGAKTTVGKASSSNGNSTAEGTYKNYGDLRSEIKKAEESKIISLRAAYDAFMKAQTLLDENKIHEAEEILASTGQYADYPLMEREIESLNAKIDSIKAKIAREEETARKNNKTKFESLKNEAQAAEKNKKFDEALALLKKAQELNVGDVSVEIGRVTRLCYTAELSGTSDFLNTIRLASPAAFVGQLKNWITVHGMLDKEELLAVGSFLHDKIEGMNSSAKKDWKNYKKWKNIDVVIGKDAADELFKAATEKI